MAVHYEKGLKNSVAFVFSCPGRHEKAAEYPAAKVTGTNLEKLLQILSKMLDRDNLSRGNITIANAWECVEYEKLTNRSEATNMEIRTSSNIYRLGRELAHVAEFIVFCGAKAKVASEELVRTDLLPNNPCFLFLEHLGTRGLLSISEDRDGNRIVSAEKQMAAGRKAAKHKIEYENTEKRLEVVAKSLIDQLNRVTPKGSAVIV